MIIFAASSIEWRNCFLLSDKNNTQKIHRNGYATVYNWLCKWNEIALFSILRFILIVRLSLALIRWSRLARLATNKRHANITYFMLWFVLKDGGSYRSLEWHNLNFVSPREMPFIGMDRTTTTTRKNGVLFLCFCLILFLLCLPRLHLKQDEKALHRFWQSQWQYQSK